MGEVEDEGGYDSEQGRYIVTVTFKARETGIHSFRKERRQSWGVGRRTALRRSVKDNRNYVICGRTRLVLRTALGPPSLSGLEASVRLH